VKISYTPLTIKITRLWTTGKTSVEIEVPNPNLELIEFRRHATILASATSCGGEIQL
jgi:hypothetical protein